MSNPATRSNLAQPFSPVKSNDSSSSYGVPASMIHHKVLISRRGKMIVSFSRDICKPYGVSSSQWVLSPGLLLKKFEYVRDCLQNVIGLSPAQREATLRLLRYWAYYGNVYVKESQVTLEPGCSKATYWRTIRLLRDLGLLKVVNRFVIRPHAQISNLYRLDKLIILIAKYLAEHIAHVWPDWLDPYFKIPWPELWSAVFSWGDILCRSSPPYLSPL